jgi:hypothetical protein
MRLVAATLVGMFCCSSQAIGQEPSPPKSVDLPEFIRKQNRDDEIAAKQLPVDYHECLLPIFLDQMEEMATTEGQRLYVSVFGRDMDAQFQELLAKRGVNALPASAHVVDPDDRRTHTSDWSYFMGRLVAEPLGNYGVDAGYQCGALYYCKGIALGGVRPS